MGTKIKGTKILIYNAPEEKALFKNGFFYRFVTLQTPQPISSQNTLSQNI